jgi:hypothetical protein
MGCSCVLSFDCVEGAPLDASGCIFISRYIVNYRDATPSFVH